MCLRQRTTGEEDEAGEDETDDASQGAQQCLSGLTRFETKIRGLGHWKIQIIRSLNLGSTLQKIFHRSSRIHLIFLQKNLFKFKATVFLFGSQLS